MSSAACMPRPVLCRVPRTRQSSHPGTKVARAHLRVGFEAAAGKHDGFRGDVLIAARTLDANAADGAVARLQQVAHLRRVAHLDAPLLRALEQRVDQAPASAHRLDVDAAVKTVLAVHQVRLAAKHGQKAHPLRSHPDDRLARAANEDLRQLIAALPVGDPHQVIQIGLPLQWRHGNAFDLGGRQVYQHILAQIVDAGMHEAKPAGREKRVAAPFILRRLLQHQHFGSALARGDRGAQRRVSCADDNHIESRGSLLHSRTPL